MPSETDVRKPWILWFHLSTCQDVSRDVTSSGPEGLKNEDMEKQTGTCTALCLRRRLMMFLPASRCPIFQLNLKSSKSGSTSLNRKKYKKNYKSNRNSSPGLTLLFPTAQPQRSLLHILKNSIGMKSMKSWKRWNPSLDQDTRAVRGGLRKKTTKQSRGWDVLDSAAQHVMRLPLISLESKHKSTNLL